MPRLQMDRDHREEMNHQAYMDVLDCTGPSRPWDDVYMECYRIWYPLGWEYQREQDFIGDFD